MYLMYALASLPFAYVFSFIPSSSIIGFTNFFILNVIACVIDAVVSSTSIFIKNSSPSTGPSKAYSGVTIARSIFAILLPTVNLKQSLWNIELHETGECISMWNSIVGTSFASGGSFMSTKTPGVGAQFIIFFVQIIFWWVMLIVIENWNKIRRCCSYCCCCCCSDDSADPELINQWDDSV